jgi:hypothetical protein
VWKNKKLIDIYHPGRVIAAGCDDGTVHMLWLPPWTILGGAGAARRDSQVSAEQP